MRSYVAAFVTALVVAALLTPLVRLLGLRVGAVSPPGGRHVHHASVPRIGGISIAVAFAVPMVALFVVDSAVAAVVREGSMLVIGAMLGSAIMVVTGLVDDTRGLRVAYKLGLQIAAACIAYAFGYRITAVHLPLIGDLSMGVFGLPVTVLWIVGVTNAVNLIDGLDGLAAGVVFFAALTNFVVTHIAESVLIAVMMAAMMGALLGFLIYNFNPARIFMGDAGSYFLGFLLAATSLAGTSHKKSTAVSLLVPIVALGVPIFDTLFSIVRRWLERRPIFSPDRGHVHHRLLDMGITHRRAVLILYGICVVFMVAAIGISLGQSWEIGIALVAVTATTIGLVRSLGYVQHLHWSKRQKIRLYDHHTERLRALIPVLMKELDSARDEAEGWQVLARLMEEAEFDYFEVLSAEDKTACYHRWSTPPRSVNQVRGVVSAEFPVGRDDNARTWIKFGWRPESEDVSPQNDILLRLIVDAVDRRFAQFGSEVASRRPVLASTDMPTSKPLGDLTSAEQVTDVAIPLSHGAR
jgi:UDP-GlcNAc:undecaprenyl-phosphate GlcNAc-1-phosphate transferase